MAKDFYQILGIDRNASDKEISKAFKKKAILYHPDKWTNKSEKEQKEAEEKFKEINEAYSVLSDPKKKQQYDMFGSVDGNTNFNSEFGFDFANMNPEDIFSAFTGFENPFTRHRNTQEFHEKGKSIQMDIPLSIEEIYNGCIKKVKYKRNIRCSVCHGDGGTGKKQCDFCHGSGYISEVTRTGFGFSKITKPCMHCHGTGYIVEHECQSCHGTGLKQQETILELNIPANSQDSQIFSFQGKGSESKDSKGANGDFYAVIKHNYNTKKYRIIEDTLIENVEIPYYDALLGSTIEIELPNKNKRKFIVNPCTKPGTALSSIGDGLFNHLHNRRGTFIIQINYKIPDNLSKEERKLLEKIKINFVN